jgi:CDP-glycerol glycerophosphotransferase (TagB/SpsB family)
MRKLLKKKNMVLFISERGSKLTGNLKFIYEDLQKNEIIKTEISSSEESFKSSSIKHKILTCIKMAKADAIILDNYFEPINYFNFQNQFVLQLWHACGALKPLDLQEPRNLELQIWLQIHIENTIML